MDQIYQFKDWMSASRMVNQYDPCIIVDVGVELYEETICGYCLTIINTKTNTTMYRFYVNSISHPWSLSTAEAIEILNSIGFPCEYPDEDPPSEELRVYLEDLLGTGVTQISRHLDKAGKIFYKGWYPADPNAIPLKMGLALAIELQKFVPGYNMITTIKGILE